MRILVVGSINMDFVLRTERVPESGESILCEEFRTIPGGKGANQATALARLGADAVFAGRIGKDGFGAELRRNLETNGVCTEFLSVDDEAPTGTAFIILESSGANRIMVFPGANMKLGTADIERAMDNPFDAVMTNLEIPAEVVRRIAVIAKEKHIPAVLDAGPARGFDISAVPGLDIVSPNETETSTLTGLPCSTVEEAERAAARLSSLCRANHVVIKMGSKGALLHSHGKTEFFPAYEVKAVDTTAAGDAFTAALTIEYIRHGNIGKAMEYANAAGALAVTRLGAQPSLPYGREVDLFLKNAPPIRGGQNQTGLVQ